MSWYPLAGKPSSELHLGLALQPPTILDSVESPFTLLGQWIKRLDVAAEAIGLIPTLVLSSSFPHVSSLSPRRFLCDKWFR